MAFNKELTLLMGEKGLSDEKLATLLGVTSSTVRRWREGTTAPIHSLESYVLNYLKMSVPVREKERMCTLSEMEVFEAVSAAACKKLGVVGSPEVEVVQGAASSIVLKLTTST